jgi:CPA2 family monovalent cation:H+ antiporter-2
MSRFTSILAAGADGAVMTDLLVVLATAAIISLVFRRLKLSTIPGYLIAGAVFGPNALGLVGDSSSIDSISHVAIILLMFGIGLHLDRKDLRSGFIPILGIGALSTAFTIGLGLPIAMQFGLSFHAALASSAALAMSSTAVVLRILQQKRQLRLPHGRIIFGTLITQDLAVVAILAFMPVLAKLAGVTEADSETSSGIVGLVASSLTTVGGVGLIILVGSYTIPRLMHEAAKESTHELLLICAAAIGLGAAVLTGALGLSPELGAFLAGFLLAGTPFRHQLSGQLGPMRDLFMAVFFTAVGLGLQVEIVMELWWVVLIGVVAVFVIKTLSIGGTSWLLGAPPIVAGVVGLSLAQAGEFSLVITGVAADNGLYGADAQRVQAVIIGIVFVSLLLTPNLLSAARSLAAPLAFLPRCPLRKGASLTSSYAEQDLVEGDRRVIVAGYGLVGRAIAAKLGSANFNITIVEMNPETVRRQKSIGRRVVFGDITNEEVLESSGAASADAVLLTMPDDEAVLRATRAIRRINPSAFIAARTNFMSGAFLAKEVGADHVTVEEVATAEVMAAQIYEQFENRVDTETDADTSPASS